MTQVEVKIFYMVSDKLPAVSGGEEVLYLRPGNPYVWIIHPEYEERFLSSTRGVGIVPVELELDTGETLIPIPALPKQNTTLPEYIDESAR